MTSLFYGCAFLIISVSVSTRSTPLTYNAAAVQHVAQYGKDAAQTLALNYEEYNGWAQKASAQGMDVVVFSEAGVGWDAAHTRNTVLPFCTELPEVVNGTPHIIACRNSSIDQTSQFAIGSCLALNHTILTAINTCEVIYCNRKTDPNCPSDGRYQFNTDMVFDKDGSLVAKYHKSHLFSNDNKFDQPVVPDAVWFDSLMGVRFGIIICYDVMFRHPLDELVKMGVKDFIWSGRWANGSPMQDAMSYQVSRSRTAGVNFVAANTGIEPNKGGGGIISYGKIINHASTFNDTNMQFMVTGTLTTPPKPPTVYPQDVPAWVIQGGTNMDNTTTETYCKLINFESPMNNSGPCRLIQLNNYPKNKLLTFSHQVINTYYNFTCQLSMEIADIAEGMNPTFYLMKNRAKTDIPHTIDQQRNTGCEVAMCLPNNIYPNSTEQLRNSGSNLEGVYSGYGDENNEVSKMHSCSLLGKPIPPNKMEQFHHDVALLKSVNFHRLSVTMNGVPTSGQNYAKIGADDQASLSSDLWDMKVQSKPHVGSSQTNSSLAYLYTIQDISSNSIFLFTLSNSNTFRN